MKKLYALLMIIVFTVMAVACAAPPNPEITEENQKLSEIEMYGDSYGDDTWLNNAKILSNAPVSSPIEGKTQTKSLEILGKQYLGTYAVQAQEQDPVLDSVSGGLAYREACIEWSETYPLAFWELKGDQLLLVPLLEYYVPPSAWAEAELKGDESLSIGLNHIAQNPTGICYFVDDFSNLWEYYPDLKGRYDVGETVYYREGEEFHTHRYCNQAYGILESVEYEVKYTSGEPSEKLLKAFFEHTVIQKVSPDIQVYRKYLVRNADHFNWGYLDYSIFYETDMGDFVQFNDKLFPLNAYCKYRAYLEYQDLRDAEPVEEWDISCYCYEEDTFDIYAPLPTQAYRQPQKQGDDSPQAPSTEPSSATSPIDEPANDIPWPVYAAAGCVVTVGAVAAILLLRRKKKA